jgi:hypothetical protein
MCTSGILSKEDDIHLLDLGAVGKNATKGYINTMTSVQFPDHHILIGYV